jgi:aspartyl-tRNA(Asn)/glutamyl-tRNA(Gln) amidotransferase subunit B
LESGGKVIQETRLFDPNKNETRPMRTKEEATDYRYFPDPDLLPLVLDDDFIEEVRATLPELPNAKRERFMTEYSLSPYDAGILTVSRELADYFEAVVKAAGGEPKLCANWVMGDLAGALNKEGKSIESSPVSPKQLGELIKRIADKTISSKIAKTVFEAMYAQQGNADDIIERAGLKQMTDATSIENLIDEVLAANPHQLEQYQAGKEKLFGFFIGQVMKVSKGKANPQQLNALLKKKLSKRE